MNITLRNDFHNTSVTLRLPENGKLSKRQVQRARRTLCPSDGCICGGSLGQRGPQDLPIPEGKRYYQIEMYADGTARITFC